MRLKKKIVVIGGNAAGAAAAAKAKRINPACDVFLYEQSPFISIGTCEMPYVLSKEIDSWKKIVFFNEESFRVEKKVEVKTNCKAIEISPREKKIKLLNIREGTSFYDSYDKLIIAVGAKSRKIFKESFSNLFYFKNIQDLISLLDYLEKNKAKSAAVIGAGYIGLELSEALKKLGLTVYLIEQKKYPLSLAEIETSSLILNDLQKNGVVFFGEVKDLNFIDDGNKIKEIIIEKNIKIQIDIAICSCGFEPNLELAKTANLKIGNSGAIFVDNKMQTSKSDIYAAGDCVEVLEKISKRRIYLPLATLAREQGYVAGANAAGDNLIANPVIRNIAIKFFDKFCGIVGLNSNELNEYGLKYQSVSAVAYQIVPVMPGKRKVFGKILFEKSSRRILGANFYGGSEIAGYCDLISTMINSELTIDSLSEVNFNYTPPLSPFINILSLLAKKAKTES